MFSEKTHLAVKSVLILFLFGLFTIDWVNAQEHTISGYVEDRSSGERIPDVEIYFPDLERGAVTNQYGFYSFATSSTEVKLLVLHIAYEAQEFNFELLRDTTLNVSLVPREINLDELEVVASPDRAVDNIQMSQHKIEIAQIETLPVLLGEPDIQKLLQLLPGVQAGQEGSSGLYIRGGRADQNLILLDGLPVYNPSHLFGFFSVFPAQALKSVKLLKGGFPARYGGRLSSVVDYTIKEGNMKTFGGQAAVGIVSSRILLEGPIKKEKASFLFSARRTFIDLLLQPFQDRSTGWNNVSFYDLHFKANYIISQKDRLYLSAYAGKDLLAYRYKSNPDAKKLLLDNVSSNIQWGNRLLALRWNRIVNDRTFVNILTGLTSYSYSLDHKTTSQPAKDTVTKVSEDNWTSEIVDATFKIDAEHNASTRHYLRFGVEGILHRIQPGRSQLRTAGEGEDQKIVTSPFPTDQIQSSTLAAYVEDELFLNRRIRVNVGLRLSSYLVEGGPYWSLEPRLSANVRISERVAAKLSATTMQQYIHLLTKGGARLPNDLWVPSTEKIRPQNGQQIALGFAWSSLSGKYELSLETYWRRMQRLLEYETNANTRESAILNWSELVEEGRGQAIGLELFAQKKTGRWTGWVGYTLGKTTRKFEKLNDGNTFPDGFDRRHDLSIVSQYRITDQIEFAATWVYGSGYPLWLPVGRLLSDESANLYRYPIILVDFGPLNSSRAPDYHRLDAGIHFGRTLSWASRKLSLGIYNAYGRNNPFYIYTKFNNDAFIDEGSESSSKTPVKVRQVSLFQWIPSLSYQLNF